MWVCSNIIKFVKSIVAIRLDPDHFRCTILFIKYFHYKNTFDCSFELPVLLEVKKKSCKVIFFMLQVLLAGVLPSCTPVRSYDIVEVVLQPMYHVSIS